MKEKFLVEALFPHISGPLTEIFEGCTYAWEPLAHLESFFEKAELGKIESQVPEGVHLVHPELISIGKNVLIEPGAYIRGPCIIGDGCEVRHNAYLRGFVLAGSNCVLGHCSEFKRVILLDGVCAAHFNYVGDSILGAGANLGAGVKLANLRLDHTDVLIYDQSGPISTGLQKLGAIIGEGAKIGCNAVTNPGTVIGKGAFCYPSLLVGGFVPPGAILKSTEKTVTTHAINRNSL